ncbi:AAA-like domain-containing protein [Prosthecobacter fluviatilis]|uniref:AAA-like domain-containing protein n=1 Tax=Prosthecobacter fluviatilis TaxID=445931 RepID=A0ABW0KWV8_9BACT
MMKKHDVFISYRSSDRDCADNFRTVLEANGLRCWIDQEGIALASRWDDSISQAICNSLLMCILISDNTVLKPDEQRRELLVADKYKVPVVPLYVAAPDTCRVFEFLLATTQHFDASTPPLIEKLESAAVQIRQLIGELKLRQLKSEAQQPAAAAKPRPVPAQAPAPVPAPAPASPSAPAQPPLAADKSSVAILYRRNVVEDERLLGLIYERLQQRGHRVFVDKNLEVGSDWRRVIREKVETADIVIPLLSMFSIGSEMLEEEIEIAQRRQNTPPGGTPRILPVRVAYEGELPPGMAHALQHLQYQLWHGPEDDEALLQSITEAVERPQPPPATQAQQRENPVGAVPLTSPFYVVRNSDAVFEAGIDHCDSIVLVKGARQMGKTSLIARGLQRARKNGSRVVIIDFQTLNESDFATLDTFYRALAYQLAEQLDIDATYDEPGSEGRAPNVRFERFVKRRIIGDAQTPIVWALDEVDRLFPCGFSTEVFGLFRSWHNARQLNPASVWSQLSLVIGFATEATLFIKDVNQSPFNVGTRVTLADFTFEEVKDLNARYGHPLANDEQIRRLMEAVGGQPFLVRRSLYALTIERTESDPNAEFEKLIANASRDSGVFGDHLRRFFIALHRDPELEAAVRGFIKQGRELDPDSFLRLRSAGLIVGEIRQEAQVRCGIYRRYLEDHLV